MFDAGASHLSRALRIVDRHGVRRGYLKALHERVVAYARQGVAAGRPRPDVADARGLSVATLARRA